MQINSPLVLKELMDRHTVYEKALMDNDVALLDALFWDSPHALRFGVMENLHGTAEIQAFRKARPAMGLKRTVTRMEIVALGDMAGVINLEFTRVLEGIDRQGRQTQVWARMPEGWRIVSAHVSLLPGTPDYMDAAAACIGLPISAGDRTAVAEDITRLGSVAQFLMAFPLSQDVETAPVFQP